jgi:L-asparaginase II
VKSSDENGYDEKNDENRGGIVLEADIKVYRGAHVESTHAVHVAVVDAAGKLLYAHGNPDRPTFPRSSLKPLQAVPVVETGAADAFGFRPEHLALCCASHNGEPLQRERVLEMLAKAGLEERHLKCGTHVPKDAESWRKLVREGKELTPVYSNCSGKHAGMLATAVHMKEDVGTYHRLEHPVQQRILQVVSRFCAVPAERIETGVDGCGVPVHLLPLRAIALGFARLAAPDAAGTDAAAVRRITGAMTAHPDMVAGARRLDTDLMRAYRGRLVSKAGAEAVQCIGDLERGIGIAVKVEDGGTRALDAAAMSVLRQLGIGGEDIFAELKSYAEPVVENMHGEPVGHIEAAFRLAPVNR